MNQRVMALIPARAGSKRLPGKNKACVGGLPLYQRAIRCAQEAGIFTNIVVSTNDPDILRVNASVFGKEVSLLDRPEALCEDSTPMLPVLKHAIEVHPETDVIVLLQPTSPFRSSTDVVMSYALLRQTGGDAVVSVTDAPDALAFQIGHAWRLRPAKGVVVPNGAVYIITADHLRAGGDWYNGLSYAYSMPKERSLDVDTDVDLAAAHYMVSQGKVAA